VDCEYCGGRGHTGGGFRGPEIEDCYWCNKSGKKLDYSHITEPKPEMPKELVVHMRTAFEDWLRAKAVMDAEDERNPVIGV
jgi:hypothetical protein